MNAKKFIESLKRAHVSQDETVKTMERILERSRPEEREKNAIQLGSEMGARWALAIVIEAAESAYDKCTHCGEEL